MERSRRNNPCKLARGEKDLEGYGTDGQRKNKDSARDEKNARRWNKARNGGGDFVIQVQRRRHSEEEKPAKKDKVAGDL